jgi:SET domain-containing protein
MFLVKTKIGQSEIHGIGLFADQFIPANTLVFEEGDFTIKFSIEKYNSLPEVQKHFLDVYSYLRDGFYHLSLENDRFMNHSENPNTYEDGPKTFALKDIQIGEELTCDYNVICEDYKKGIRVDP